MADEKDPGWAMKTPWQGKALRIAITGIALTVATVFWVRGLLQSPLVQPDGRSREQSVAGALPSNSRELQREAQLAQGYWQRYRDVRQHDYWGEKGFMGIRGPRDHFRQHGRREGRIFAPVLDASDMAREKKLAEAYWRRYPDVRASAVWGERSDLQFLGPRDHFTYVGRYEGRIWGSGMMEGVKSDHE